MSQIVSDTGTYGEEFSMKRVGVYAHTFLATSETFIYNQVRAFKSYEPFVMCAQQDNVERFPLGDTPCVNFSQFTYGARSNIARVPVIGHTVHRGILDGCRALSFRRNRASLVLAHFGPAGLDIHRAAALAKLPLAVVFHGYDATCELMSQSFQSRYSALLSPPSVLIAASEFIRSRLVSSGAPEHMVRVHHLGIPIHQPVDTCRAGGTVLQVGRLVPVKGHAITLRAVARLRKEGRELQLRFVGGGPLWDELHALADSLGIADSVSFLGDLPQAKVRAELRAADIFVHPSVTPPAGDTEGLGLSIVEAMSSGLPVVATAHGGIPEVVTDRTGILVPEGDHNSLAEAIATLDDSRELRVSFGQAGRQRAEQKFDVAKNIHVLEQIFDDVVG